MPSPEETIAHHRVQELLRSCGGTKVDLGDESCVYLMPNDSVVKLPDGHARIPEELVQEIAMIKCEMSSWQYDYWLTRQDHP